MLLSLVISISTTTSDNGRRLDRGRDRHERRGDTAPPAVVDPDSTIVQQPDELAGGAFVRIVLDSGAESHAGIVGEEGVVRTGVVERHTLGPLIDHEFVVVARSVADDGATDPSDPGLDQSVGEHVERRRRGDRQRIVLDRIVVAGEQRVAAADEVDVAVDHPIVQGRNGHRGREGVVGSEDIERRKRDEQLLIARRDHRQVRIERCHLDTVDRHRTRTTARR